MLRESSVNADFEALGSTESLDLYALDPNSTPRQSAKVCKPAKDGFSLHRTPC
jgi:hypothetical protein